MSSPRRVALALFLTVLLAPAATAYAQKQEPQWPTELWDEYPLTPTTAPLEESPPPPTTAHAPTATEPSTPASTRLGPAAAQERAQEDDVSDIRSMLPIVAFALVICTAVAVAYRLKGGVFQSGSLQQVVSRVPMMLRSETSTPATVAEREDGQQRRAPAMPLLAEGADGQTLSPADAAPAPQKTRAPDGSVLSEAPLADERLPGAGPQGVRNDGAGPPAGKNVVPDALPTGKEVSVEVRGRSKSGRAPTPTEKCASGPPAGKSVSPKRRRPEKEPAGDPAPRAEPGSLPGEKVRSASQPTPLRAQWDKPGKRAPQAEETRVRAERSRPASETAEPEASFETCVIEQWRGFVKSDFYAIAVRSEGANYVVASSSIFHSRGDETPPEEGHTAEAHAGLVRRLVAEGWQPYGESLPWYRTSFRRQLGPTLSEPVDDPDADSDRKPAGKRKPDVHGVAEQTLAEVEAWIVDNIDSGLAFSAPDIYNHANRPPFAKSTIGRSLVALANRGVLRLDHVGGHRGATKFYKLTARGA